MLKKLLLRHVGPTEVMDFTFASRLNLLTGDNSLGKTFVLDAVWWVLTGNWAKLPALPRHRILRDVSKNTHPSDLSQIHYTLKTKPLTETITQFDPKKQGWKSENRPLMLGLVIYARAEGGFSVWDSARNQTIPSKNLEETKRPNAFHFSNPVSYTHLTLPTIYSV